MTKRYRTKTIGTKLATLRKVIKYHREGRRWSHHMLATISGLHVQAIQRIETNRRTFSPEMVERIALAFDIPLAQLRTLAGLSEEEWRSL